MCPLSKTITAILMIRYSSGFKAYIATLLDKVSSVLISCNPANPNFRNLYFNVVSILRRGKIRKKLNSVDAAKVLLYSDTFLGLNSEPPLFSSVLNVDHACSVMAFRCQNENIEQSTLFTLNALPTLSEMIGCDTHAPFSFIPYFCNLQLGIKSPAMNFQFAADFTDFHAGLKRVSVRRCASITLDHQSRLNTNSADEITNSTHGKPATQAAESDEDPQFGSLNAKFGNRRTYFACDEDPHYSRILRSDEVCEDSLAGIGCSARTKNQVKGILKPELRENRSETDDASDTCCAIQETEAKKLAEFWQKVNQNQAVELAVNERRGDTCLTTAPPDG
ncbi:hypothetical protein DFH06DRAFT_1128374 [Mycena polygramma]|nr:hypothetical protein DFH06DRAFT_1128374 [Mycena polygramma]